MTSRIPSRLARLCGTLVLGLVTATAAWAAYPERPIKLVVPFSPGGGTDAIARSLGVGMAEDLGQPVIIDNKPGAGTVIGTDYVAKSPPDGYTIDVATFAHAVNPSLMPKLPFDAEKDFAPVVMLARGPNILVVRGASPFKSVADVIAAAREGKRHVTFASQGVGTSAHMAGEMFANLAKIKLTHVPYKGAGPAMTDLLGGQVDIMFATAAAAMPQIQSGKLRALAVTTPTRSTATALKNVPALAETVPGFSVESWYGLFVPAGTPKDVIARLNTSATKAMANREFRKKIESEGLTASPGTPQALGDYVHAEQMRWKKVVDENHLRPE